MSLLDYVVVILVLGFVGMCTAIALLALHGAGAL